MPRVARPAPLATLLATTLAAAGVATAAPAAAPPAINSVRLPATISAQQGHARFLVGVRLATRSKLTVQVIAASGGRVVQTTTDTAERPAGRAYLRLDATDSSGFQLLQGAYRVRLQATDSQGRVSAEIERPFRLKLTPPRGLFDAYTLPLMRAFARQAGTKPGGRLVAVVAPKGAAAAAGLRRGDVITSVAGRSVEAPGAWATALRALPADKAVPVEYLRKGVARTGSLEAGPDWEASADLAKSLVVAVRREPRTLAYSIAQARQMVDSGKLTEARAVIRRWPKSWRTSAPGQLLQGDLLFKQNRWKPALGAFNRARARDKTLAAAEFGRGVALSSMKKGARSGAAFAAAARLDPTDAAAAGFEAYARINAKDIPEALIASRRAVALDPRYADAFLPFGISLLASGNRSAGIKALRRGLVLLEEQDRVAGLISKHLDPVNP